LKSCIRASSPDDRPAIVALMRAAGLQIDASESHFRWKYWQDRSDWPGPRSFVVADDSEIHAHTGIVPGAIRWPGGRATVLHMIDWVASPSVAGAGIALLKHVGGLCDAMIAVGGTVSTRRVLPTVGFRPQGEAQSYVRILRPWRNLRQQSRWSWKTLPKFGRNALRALRAPMIECGPWSASQVARSELASLEPVLSSVNRGTATMERSLAGLAHFLQCPVVPVEAYALRKDDRLAGYFVLAVAGGQARLADSWVAPADPAEAAAAWHGLVQCAIRSALLHEDVVEIVSVASDPAFAAALAGLGFRLRASEAIQVRRKSKASSTESLPPVRFQMLDSDAVYLASGSWS
jgi:hypothetical protein